MVFGFDFGVSTFGAGIDAAAYGLVARGEGDFDVEPEPRGDFDLTFFPAAFAFGEEDRGDMDLLALRSAFTASLFSLTAAFGDGADPIPGDCALI